MAHLDFRRFAQEVRLRIVIGAAVGGMTTNWIASLALNRGGTRLYAGTGSGESGGGVFAARVR